MFLHDVWDGRGLGASGEHHRALKRWYVSCGPNRVMILSGCPVLSEEIT